jgi:hypothetical protein
MPQERLPLTGLYVCGLAYPNTTQARTVATSAQPRNLIMNQLTMSPDGFYIMGTHTVNQL